MKDPIPQAARDLLKQRRDLQSVYNHIQDDLDKVEESLSLFSTSPNQLISEISCYLFQKKGKRIRPALLVLCSKLLDYRGNEHILMGALVEFIHTASLIHDDIIDNADVRRGIDSVHTRWGPNISVLLGDYLYIRTIGLSLESRHPQVIRILTAITAQMIEGELTEYHNSGNLRMSEDDYLDIIHKKTAALFGGACQIGGVLGQASTVQENVLLAYGRNLGMTFQIIDDLLDFQGDEKKLGKPILSDLSEGRITLPLIYTLNNNGKSVRQRLLQIIQGKVSAKDAKQEIADIVKTNGALDYAYKKAEKFSRQAREIISQFPESAHRKALSALAEFVLSRDR